MKITTRQLRRLIREEIGHADLKGQIDNLLNKINTETTAMQNRGGGGVTTVLRQHAHPNATERDLKQAIRKLQHIYDLHMGNLDDDVMGGKSLFSKFYDEETGEEIYDDM